ncbi:MAG: RagB/SusD family nutrient uptake outer membrane protein [Bacteroidaceae bacterium]|nr:RagB/SusD family nutrient uptake outer membrane protein [Bacteroidaceae bacterium]
MMKNFITYVLLVSMLVVPVSCLDKFPENAVLENSAITTVDEADQAMVGIYSSFLSGALYSGYLTLLPDIQCDMVYAVNGYTNTFGDIWRWEILATNSQIEAVYGSLYSLIGNCNFLLDNAAKLEKTLTNDTELDRLEIYCGEAYFARALAYSELIKLYCVDYKSDEEAKNELGVVLKTKYYENQPIKRASLYDSYQLVLSDLDKAAELLKLDEGYTPSDLYNSSVYFNEYTVYALRARVALYMRDYEAAIKYSSKIIDSNMYLLSSVHSYIDGISYYDYMWQYDHSSEVIWKVGFTSTNYGGALGTVFWNYDYSSFKPDYVPAKWVLDLYGANDLRYNAFFYNVQTGYSHGLAWPLLYKYWGNQSLYSEAQLLNTSMPKVFRLSEQYLIRAEAYCQLETPDYSRAGKDISTLIAARCTNSSVALNANNAMEIIEQERIKELYMEGFRLQDLKRWGKGFERTPQDQSLSNGSSLKITADNPLFVWPIPQHEIESPGADIEPNESNR